MDAVDAVASVVAWFATTDRFTRADAWSTYPTT